MKNLGLTVNSETGFAVYKNKEGEITFTEFSGYKTSKLDRAAETMKSFKKGEYRLHVARMYRPEVLLVQTDLDAEAIKYGALPYIVGSPTHDKSTVRIGQILGKQYVSLIGIPAFQIDSFHENLKKFGTDLRSISYYGEGLYQLCKDKAKTNVPTVIISSDGTTAIGLVFINGLLCAARYYNDCEHKFGFVERLIGMTTLAQDLPKCQVALFTDANDTWQKQLKGFDILKIKRYFSDKKEIVHPMWYNSLGLMMKKGGIFNV